MENKDIMIASLRKELQETHAKCSALEQENALLENEVERLKRKIGKPHKPFDVIRNTIEK
jgi:cell division protein FtsB